MNIPGKSIAAQLQPLQRSLAPPTIDVMFVQYTQTRYEEVEESLVMYARVQGVMISTWYTNSMSVCLYW